MKFYSVHDLRTDTKSMWANLKYNGEAIITNNGKPAALILDISEDNFEIMLQAVNQAKAMIAFNNMRSRAASKGFMSEEEIESEITAVKNFHSVTITAY